MLDCLSNHTETKRFIASNFYNKFFSIIILIILFNNEKNNNNKSCSSRLTTNQIKMTQQLKIDMLRQQ